MLANSGQFGEDHHLHARPAGNDEAKTEGIELEVAATGENAGKMAESIPEVTAVEPVESMAKSSGEDVSAVMAEVSSVEAEEKKSVAEKVVGGQSEAEKAEITQSQPRKMEDKNAVKKAEDVIVVKPVSVSAVHTEKKTAPHAEKGTVPSKGKRLHTGKTTKATKASAQQA